MSTSRLGVPLGVSQLDARGNVTAPVDSSLAIFSTGVRVAPLQGNTYPNSTRGWQLPGYSMWWGNQIGLGAYKEGSNTTTVADSWITPPETLHLGGQSEGASGFLNVHCNPYAGSNAGTCSQIMVGTPNIQGQAAGIGPGATGLANYDNFDAVNQTLQATGSTPLYVITSNTAQNVFPPTSDGKDHTPVFTADGATFANPLPADMSAWLVGHQQGVRLMTNEVGCQNCAIQTYGGIITGLTQNTAGLVTGIKVGAWQVLGSGNSSAGQIPGTSTTDGSAPALDTTWSNFGAPAIMVGVYTKDFSQYSLCTLGGPNPNGGRGDINYPSGGANNQLRVCEGWEMDLWNDDPVDYRPTLHGLTVAYSKRDNGGIPSHDSYDVLAAGANSVSYKQSGEYFTLPFWGGNFMVSGYNGTAYPAGSVKNVVQWRQSERTGYSADGGWARNNVMSGIWTVRNVQAGCDTTDNVTCDDPNGSSKDITTNIGVQTGWYGSPNTGPDGDPIWNDVQQEHIELNPKSTPNGIGFCSGDQTDQTCSLMISGSGVTAVQTLVAQSGLSVGVSQPLTFPTGSQDSNNQSIQMRYDPNSNTLLFTNNHYGNTYSFNGAVAASGYAETLTTPSSSSSPCKPGQFTDDANYHYVCVATNKWKRVLLSDF